MAHPLWQIRAKLAKRMNTHPFDPRIMELDDAQLGVVFYQIREDERFEQKKITEMIKVVNEAWVNNFKNLFDELKLYVNPTMFQKIMEMQKLDLDKQEINEENFEEKWSEIKAMIPETFVADQGENVEVTLPEVDDAVFAGWVPYQTKK